MSRYASQINLVLRVYPLNVPQILHHGVIYFAEVKFYFIQMIGDERQAFALISLYSPPNEYLLQTTDGTLVVCRYRGEGALIVVSVKSILSVIAMALFPFLIDGHGEQYFMIEKAGLDVIEADTLEDSD